MLLGLGHKGHLHRRSSQERPQGQGVNGLKVSLSVKSLRQCGSGHPQGRRRLVSSLVGGCVKLTFQLPAGL